MAVDETVAKPTGAALPGPAARSRGRRALGALQEHGGPSVTLLLIFAYFAFTQSSFVSAENLENILRTNMPLLLAAIGMTFVIISGGLDLSLGSMAALASVILGELLVAGVPPLPALVITALACAAIGLIFNGMSIGWLGFNFFIVTLATLSIFRGAALVISDAKTVSTFDWQLVQTVGDGEIIGLPVPVLIGAFFTLLAWYVLRYTRFGRMIYAVGGNEEAARISGINVTRVRVAVYGIAGLMAGVSGLVLTGRLTSSQPVTGGIGLELQAAAAVLLGGTKFTGGHGGVTGTLVGVLYIGVLQSGLTIAGVQSYWQHVATGAILFLAVAFDRLRKD
jgi:ribose/xylose/arabinose/galactoside ABC-type transport system permease subunit